MAEAPRELEYWSVWYPKAASTGVLIARGVLEPSRQLLLHAPGELVTVEVHDQQGCRVALGRDLPRTQQTPIARLRRDGDEVTREDIWPEEPDLGWLVLLPGGEVGRLLSWWHAEDRSEWRWQVEFHNVLGGNR